MSDIIPKNSSDLSKRQLEAKAGKGDFANIKMLAATFYKNFIYETTQRKPHEIRDRLIQSKQLIFNLIDLARVCRDSHLKDGRGIYAEPYYLSGSNIDYNEIDERVKKGELPSHACYFGESKHLTPLLQRFDVQRKRYEKLIEKIDDKGKDEPLADHEIDARDSYKKALESNKLNPLSFDKDLRAAKKLSKFMQTLILGDFQIDEESKKNIQDAYALAKKTGKKLVLNCNHAGHTDSNLIGLFRSYLVEQGILAEEKEMPEELQMKLRLLCGFYMPTTPGVRSHVAGSNVLLVPGINDMDYFKKNLKKEEILELFKWVKKGFGADPAGEVMVMFPTAGRGEYGGNKDEIPIGSERYIIRPDCVYVNVHFTGSDNMYAAFANQVAVFNRFTPEEVKVAIGKPYLGGTKTTEQVFQEMVAQRDLLQPHWRGAERVEKAQKNEIAAAEAYIKFLSKIEPYRDIIKAYCEGSVAEEKLPASLIEIIEEFESGETFIKPVNNLKGCELLCTINEHDSLVDALERSRSDLENIMNDPTLGHKAKKIKIT